MQAAFEFVGSAILFDMDGTLIDSTLCVERQWRRWAQRHGLDAEKILAVAHGRRNAETIRDVAPHLATTEELARFDEEELTDSDGILAVPGAAELLAGLPEAAWAVVTSASRRLAEVRLAAAGLPVPKILVSAGDVTEGKPDPQGYLLAAQLIKAAPSLCLVVEDTPSGLEAARAAGMPSLGITTTYRCDQLGKVPCISDFKSVLLRFGDREAKLRIKFLTIGNNSQYDGANFSI
jgi:HAD superfamily hydrolase (TIGR01509 family)